MAPDVISAICPFLDVPRSGVEYTAQTFEDRLNAVRKSLRKVWRSEFYFDEIDLAESFLVKGDHPYSFALKCLRPMQVVPVVGLGREKHNQVVSELKQAGDIASQVTAIRILKEDFEDFDVVSLGCRTLVNSLSGFQKIDLILDCQFSSNLEASQTAQCVATFTDRFCATYTNVRRVIVTGSSIPSSVGEIVPTKDVKIIPRGELAVFCKARRLCSTILTLGDYTVVSPFFSELAIPKNALRSVTTPRIIYSFDTSHYIGRGSSLKKGGDRQYVGLTKALCAQDFFRRASYSPGEDYIYERSLCIGNNATNASIIKPSVISHITYMVRGIKL